MTITRRVRSHFRDGADAYWCTWRTLGGITRSALLAADELERIPNPDAPRGERLEPETFPATVDYGTITIDREEVEP